MGKWGQILALYLLLGLVLCFPGSSAGEAKKQEASPMRLSLSPRATTLAGLSQIEGALGILVPDETWAPRVSQYKVRGAGSDLYAKAAPAIVVIRLDHSYGTGFLIDSEGWLITNHHVVAAAATDRETGAQVVNVHLGRLENGAMQLVSESIPALVFKDSEDKDLALLRITRLPVGATSLPALHLASSSPSSGGDCVAIGHPHVGTLWNVRDCEVTGIATWPEEMIDTVMLRLVATDEERVRLKRVLEGAPKRKVLVSSCPLSFGDSGGPLLNQAGEVIGVSFGGPGGKESSAIGNAGFSYHVHLDDLRSFIADRPNVPLTYVPDAWPAAVYIEEHDLNRDGKPDTLAFGTEHGGPLTGVLVDLDEDSGTRFTAEQRGDIGRTHAWDFELGIQRVPQWRTFYDTDNDGKVDLILDDIDRDGMADAVLTLENGAWKRGLTSNRKLLDGSNFRDKSLRDLFAANERLIAQISAILK